jgi:hypothetical protein
MVTRQIEEVGLARRTEVEALKARIEDLERRLGKGPGASPAKRTTAKSPAKRGTARRAAQPKAVGAPAKRSSAKTPAKGTTGSAARRSKSR